MNTESVGRTAGVIWNILNERGTMEYARMKDELKLTQPEMWSAIGWLLREDKISIKEQKKGKKNLYHISLIK